MRQGARYRAGDKAVAPSCSALERAGNGRVKHAEGAVVLQLVLHLVWLGVWGSVQGTDGSTCIRSASAETKRRSP
jgi:hypothetical protein